MVLAEKNDRIFDFIEEFIAQHGYSPSVREIQAGTSLGVLAVERGLRTLRRAGFIDYQDSKARTIVIPRYSLTAKGREEVC